MSGRPAPDTIQDSSMRVDEFDFDLPESSIALRPASPRDSARLLVVAPGQELADRHVCDLPALLRPGDALVFNDTRVIPAQLTGQRGAAQVGVTLHKMEQEARWWSFVRNAKRLRVGDLVTFGSGFAGTVLDKTADGQVLWAFDPGPAGMAEALCAHGVMPLPPYIAARRPTDVRDEEDYQTIYARATANHPGSVAAPTAGLHFTPSLLDGLDARGIERMTLTLHVGAGTFLPVRVEDTRDHVMHAEWGQITAQTAQRLNALRARGGRIICVGTTSLRLLESAAGEDGLIAPFADETSIFITPGYRFRAADMLMTNFHLPRSTLFMLVCAFSGTGLMRRAYDHAITSGYRFYSYGDSSLLTLADSTSP